MTVPGQIPESDLAETPPAGRLLTDIRTRLPPKSRFSGFDDAHDVWRPLLATIPSVFDPGTDRIVLGTAGRVGRPESTASGEFQDAPPGSVVVTPEDGLALALGLAAARRCFGQQHWIVVVAPVDGLLRAMSHATIEQLQSLESGLLVIAVDDGQRDTGAAGEEALWAGQFDALDSRWLSEIGLDFRGPLDGDHTPEIAEALREARQAGRSRLLLVQSRPPLRSELPTESHSRGMLLLPASGTVTDVIDPHDSLPVIVDELYDISEGSPGLVAIASPPVHALWNSVSTHRGRRLLQFDAGESLITRARGAAIGGCRPVLLLDEAFLARNLTEIRTEICGPARTATILLIESAASERSASSRRTSSGPSPLAFLRLLPHTAILVPTDLEELRAMLRWSVRENGPVAIYVPRILSSDLHSVNSRTAIKPQQAEVLVDGVDLGIVVLGPHLQSAQDAAQTLSQQGISTAIVNARFANPIDVATLERLAEYVRGFVTVEPDGTHGGFGTTVLERLAARGISVPVMATRSSAAPREGASTVRKALAHRIVEAGIDLYDRGAVPERSDSRRARAPSPRRRRNELDREFLLAPDKLQAERDLVQRVELTPATAHWHDLYSRTGKRSDYLWRWCLHGVRITTLSSVSPDLFAHVCDTKLASIILCVLFDDVADEHGSGRLLTEMLRVTRDERPADFTGLDEAERLHVEVTESIWRDYFSRTQGYPRSEVYADLLRYDLMQFFNTMCYSQLLNNRPSLLNLTEHDLYTSHNMQMISFSTLDLMCSNGFCMDELGRLREAMWHAQCMGRIGNLLSTWQREIVNRDFTSGVFARAVSRGDLTLDQLTRGDADTVESAILNGAHDQYFFRRWMQHREHLRFRASQIRSIDLRPVLSGHDRFLLMHLGCRGLI